MSACGFQVTVGRGAAGPSTTSTSPKAAPKTAAPKTAASPSTVAPRSFTTGCEQSAPPGATAEAREYLAAVNAAYPGWIAITQALQTSGGLVTLDNVAAQIRVDGAFLERLSAIHFSPEPEVWAAQLRDALRQYLALLASMQNNTPSSTTTTSAVDDMRAEASGNLRLTLGLPQSSCDVMRP